MLLTKDRIKELTTTSGTGTLSLSGTAEQGFQAFSILGNGTKCYYTITDVNGTDFEVGLGTYNSNTLTRDTILESSNSGNAISLSATGSTVFVTYPAEKSSYRDIGVNRDYTASGSITAGKPLILNTDNTVTEVGTTTISAGLGTENSTTLADAEYHEEAYGKENEFVNIYRIDAGSDYNVYVTPNTISSNDLTTITKGTTSSVDFTYLRPAGIIYEPNQDKYVIISQNSSNYMIGSVVTFNGTGSSATVTIETPTVLESTAYSQGTSNQNLAYDTTAQKIVVSYCSTASSGVSIVINLSGTTLTAGSRQTVPLYGSYINDGSIKVAYSSTANRVIYLYADNNNNKYYTTVGTVSGTSISFGSTQEVTNQVTGYTNNGGNGCIAVANTGEVVLTYLNSSYELFSHAGTLSNTTMTWGSPSQVSNIICYNGSGSGGDDQCGQEPIANGKIIFARSTQSSSPSLADKGVYGVITVSGTSVTNGTPASFNDDATGGGGAYDYRYAGVTTNVSKTQAVFGSGLKTGKIDNIVLLESNQTGPSNLTTNNYFGVASSTASDTESVGVNRAGSFNNDQTGLTTGKDYYAKGDGTIVERTTTTTTPDTNPTMSTVNQQSGSSYSYHSNSIAYESTSGYYVRGRRDSSTNYPVVESGTWGSLTAGITWNTPTVLSSNSLRGDRIKVATGGGYAHCSYCTRENSNENAKVTPVAISGSGGLTLGTTTTVNTLATSGSSTQPDSIVYDTSQNTILAFFDLGWQSGYLHKVFPLQMSGANYSYSSSDAVTFASNIDMSAKSVNAIYDPDTNRTVFFYILDAGTRTVNGIVFSCSGTTITQGSTQTASFTGTPNSNGYLTLAYDTQNNKIIIMYDHNTGAPNYTTYLPKYSFVTVTGGGTNTLSYTADAYAFSDTTQRTQVVSLAWNGDANKLFMVYGAYGDSHTQCDTFTSNGSTLTSISSEELTTVAIVDSGSNETNASVFVTGKGVSYSLGDADNSPGILNFTLSLGSTTSTTINASQFVGTARSGTDLELAKPPTELVGLANGSITKGDAVVLRTDGDFSKVVSTGGNVSEFSQFTSTQSGDGNPLSNSDAIALGSDGNGTFCYLYRKNNDYPTVQLGTTDSSGNITYGTPFVLSSTTLNFRHGGVTYSPDYNNGAGGFILSAQRNSLSRCNLYGITFSGTTISYGGDANFTTGGSEAEILWNAYDTTNDKTYVWVSNPYSMMCAVTNTSGTTLSAGTPAYCFGSASSRMQFGNMIYDNTNNRGTIFYRDSGNSDYPTAMGYTVSGTTFSFGTATVLESSACNFINGAEGEADGNGTICAWQNGSGTDFKYVNLTYSGLTISLSGVTTFLSGSWVSAYQHLTYNKTSKQYIAVVHRTTALSNPQAIVGTPSSGSVSWGTAITLPVGSSGSWSSAIINETGNEAQNIYLGYTAGGNVYAGIYGSAYSNFSTNLTANNFIGFAQDTVADNEDVKVATIGQTDDNQSSLTLATQYFVNNSTGALQTTADTISVVGGTALSSTKILIKS